MTKRPKRPRGPIDFDRVTPGQQAQIQRVVQAGARIGIAQFNDYKSSMKAIRDTFDAMIEAEANEALVPDLFSALGQAATATNARRIARHPLCPQEVVDEIETRLAGQAKRAGRGTKAPTSTPSTTGGDSQNG